MRWNKNAISHASPVAALNRRPTSERKFKEQGAIAPELLLLLIETSIIIVP